jgi:hypothetical protein
MLGSRGEGNQKRLRHAIAFLLPGRCGCMKSSMLASEYRPQGRQARGGVQCASRRGCRLCAGASMR